MIGTFLNLLDTQSEKDKFIELYNEYKDLLYWIALRKTNCIEDAEECVQETFLYVAKHFNKIGEITSKQTKVYLSVIVTGFAIDIYNNSIKFNIVQLDDNNQADDVEYFENFGKIELQLILDEILDDESRFFFYLKYLYGYKSKEIAQLYKVNDSYVRKKLQYAKEKIRKKLK